ncbi:MAG: DNA primase [Bacteroidales bacterium]|nr:DNA primase [Bacteroidales bacterium]
MISKNTIEKILDAAQIVEVISDFVALKRRGADYKACCPFHNEKTPSFSVSPSRGIYKCFGCGKGGNVVNFIMEHEQLTYVEAIKYLGKKYGIEVEESEERPGEAEERLRKEALMVVSQFAADYFSNALWNTPRGNSVGLGYFKERGFSEDTVRKFGLGWCPNEQKGVCHAALQAGYKKEVIVSAGLGVQRDGSGELADRFYDRVIFPVHSISGRVIAFGGRTLRTDKNIAKYINSPESEIYVKSRSLYGIFFAKSAITKQQNCYLVEGYTDVISLHQSGIENVVASSGTSLTTEQIRMIRRFTPLVTVLYDGDNAGIKASIRGIDMLLEEGLEVKVVLFPGGEDPDSYARKHSTEELRRFLEESRQDFISFKTSLLQSGMKNDPFERSRLISDVVTSIAVIPDAISRTVYIEQSGRQLGISEAILAREVKKIRKKREYGAYSDRKDEEGKDYFPELETGERLPEFISDTYCEPAERELLYYLIKFGGHTLYGSEDDPESMITVSQFILTELQNDDLELKNLIYKNIFDEYFLHRDLGEEGIQRYFLNHTNQEFVDVVLRLLHPQHSLNVKKFAEAVIPEENVLSTMVPKAILIYKAKIASEAYGKLCKNLEDAAAKNDMEVQKAILEKIRILMQIRNSFSKELNRLTI